MGKEVQGDRRPGDRFSRAMGKREKGSGLGGLQRDGRLLGPARGPCIEGAQPPLFPRYARPFPFASPLLQVFSSQPAPTPADRLIAIDSTQHEYSNVVSISKSIPLDTGRPHRLAFIIRTTLVCSSRSLGGPPGLSRHGRQDRVGSFFDNRNTRVPGRGAPGPWLTNLGPAWRGPAPALSCAFEGPVYGRPAPLFSQNGDAPPPRNLTVY